LAPEKSHLDTALYDVGSYAFIPSVLWEMYPGRSSVDQLPHFTQIWSMKRTPVGACSFFLGRFPATLPNRSKKTQIFFVPRFLVLFFQSQRTGFGIDKETVNFINVAQLDLVAADGRR
jgi:hypothetical protein